MTEHCLETLSWMQHCGELKARYDMLCAAPSDIHLHLPRFVALAEQLDARHVIELGTRTGVSTVAWLYALRRLGDGRWLTSIDIDPRPDIGGRWPYWRFIQGDDLDPAIVSSLEPADIVFIDTSHLYAHTLAELNLYRWLVKPGGVMALHDTELAVPGDADLYEPRYPVRKAIEEFCRVNRFKWTNHPECWGLGIVEVR